MLKRSKEKQQVIQSKSKSKQEIQSNNNQQKSKKNSKNFDFEEKPKRKQIEISPADDEEDEEEEEDVLLFSKPLKKIDETKKKKIEKKIESKDEQDQEENDKDQEEDEADEEEIDQDEAKRREQERIAQEEFMAQSAKDVGPCSYESIGLAPWLISTCSKLGLTRPTPVQRNIIPPILQGKDVVACAPTGTGKTAAFALPIIQKLSQDMFGIYALVLSPTRELAKQINDQFLMLGRQMKIRTELVIGGLTIIEQAAQLDKKPHIVVATPGRIKDLLMTNPQLFSRIRYLVLDEVDHLFSTNFYHDLHNDILPKLNPKRQNILVSATINRSLEVFRKEVQLGGGPGNSKGIYLFGIEEKYAIAPNLDQRFIFMPDTAKNCYLVHVLQTESEKSAIVFVESIWICELISRMLRRFRIDCQCIHSLKPQRTRLEILSQFRDSRFPVLVATDLASRGLDIPTVDMVINHDVPAHVPTYFHRVGRTARAGRPGTSVTLVTQHDVFRLKAIEKETKIRMQEYKTKEQEVLRLLDPISLAIVKESNDLIVEGFEDQVITKREKDREKKKKRKNNKTK